MCEGVFRTIKKGQTPFKEVSATMTIDDFNKRIFVDENLVILDDTVLDITSYLNNHSGGKFVMEHNIGRDIRKFFYAGYCLENYQ